MSPKSPKVRRVRPRPCMAVFRILVLGALAACNRPASAAPGAAPVESPTVNTLRVQRDPVTGSLTPAGPTADPMLMPVWSSSVRPALDHLQVVHMVDGSLMLDLSGIYLDYATATRDWNGRLVTSCDDTWVPDVLRPLQAPPQAPALGWAKE